MNQLDALARVIDDVVAPAAPYVDESGEFPRVGIDALGEAGILGLISATEVGGGGQGMDVAAAAIEQLAAACASTAMIVMMHFSAVSIIEAHGPRDVR